MTTLPEEAVKAADIIQVITDLRLAILHDDDEGLAEHAEPMVKAKELIAKLSASPFLPVQGAVKVKELPWKDTGDSDQGRNSYAHTRIGRYEAFEMRLLKETIYGWSRGHGDEKADSFEAAKAAAQADYEARIRSAIETVNSVSEPSAARELALEALRSAEQFIENGFEFGFIRKPDEGDPALETLPKIKAAIRALSSPDHNADAGKVEGDGWSMSPPKFHRYPYFVENISGKWCLCKHHGNGASHTISVHETAREARDAAPSEGA
ncbi:hypothetical protein ACNT8L_17955 [Brucella intermedia]|uniref:hypothetical protein n=1 Tax=Brucella intermedia TaxID=94625 RepID=UPI003AB15F57